MSEEIINNVENTETQKQNNEDEKVLKEALAKLNSYGLEWTFRSIEYVINKENLSFGQLRSCVYMRDGSTVFDHVKSTILLVKAGLVGSKQIEETKAKELEDRAFEIIEDWRSTFGYIGTLHILIINQMESKHFFMGARDQAVITQLGSKNLQKDLARNLMREDLEEKIKQARALS